ncbi:uncharacterized protein THITE_2116360 [Thermothielavioides terrestris NRRL 8126]|uniref:Aldehyde dehydrogenase domain-containing protein n=1 Tax=Thermothielavioides terrestris (strain ATCC 38088 / NRRL 8126) TaxID=578455 RepID=G2R5I5_THETT|nr:uncharacterized protein THITE_2116360 [Thermothielavioides terrestris NRRL 8126]AEO67476.1 hypothetical protein THITE_2116360 [Thermothielavioides terrestris NRRL 8126]
MPRPFSKIRSAAIDGRALNPIFRKLQLKQLHDALSDKAAEIQEAIATDTGHTRAEVQIEYWLALRQLSQAHAALDPKKALHDEYAVSRGESASQREAVGIVVIHPAKHAFFSCLMSALVPALASGNCVVVETEQSLLRTPPLVLDLIAHALDQDIFDTAPAPISEADLGHPHVRVLQNGSDDAAPRLAHRLVSDPEARVVAVVERDADLDLAARELVRARFALRGRSPYAPDVVLVNEWVKREFLEAALRHAVRVGGPGGGGGGGGGEKTGLRMGLGPQGPVADAVKKERGVSVLSWSAAGAVVDVEDRKSPLLQRKVQESCLLVHAVTSIDDAIDFSQGNRRLGAAYVFTKPSAAKYICQFLDSPMSFVNHVPTSLLFLTMAPSNTPVDPISYAPYSEETFTRPKAQFASPSAQETVLAGLLLQQQGASEQLAALVHESTAKLPVFKRSKVALTHFFNQGILTGGLLLLSTMLGVTGVCTYYGFGLVRSRLLHGL